MGVPHTFGTSDLRTSKRRPYLYTGGSISGAYSHKNVPTSTWPAVFCFLLAQLQVFVEEEQFTSHVPLCGILCFSRSTQLDLHNSPCFTKNQLSCWGYIFFSQWEKFHAKLSWKESKKPGLSLLSTNTLPETNIAPENRTSQKESNLPTIHFQVLC